MPQPVIKTVGVVGLGKMGAPMARHLAAKGFSVIGHDIDPTVVKRLAAHGVTGALSPAKLAAATDLVIVVTAFERQVEDVLFGADGVADGARPGTVVGIAATISPQGMRKFSDRLVERGLIPLDIPLCRGEPAAEAGQLLIVGGGDAGAFERCRPAFSCFADSIFHLGPAGAGQVGKMVNNLILWACISANDEGLKLGEQLGVDRRPCARAAGVERTRTGRCDLAPPTSDAVGREGHEHRAARGRRSAPQPAAVRLVKEVIKGIKIERGE